MASEANKAAFEGNFAILQDILATISSDSIDAFVDAEDSRRGPLHFAILGKHANIVSRLLEDYRSSPYQADEDGWTPLHIAASVGSDMIINLLIERVRSDASGALDAVVVYCNQTTRRSGQTPLHLAASKGHEQAVLRLLSFGAMASSRNASGQTALHRAASAGHSQVAAAILEADSSIVNLTDCSEDGNSALHLAAEDGHFAVVRLLCEIGQADVNLANSRGKSAAQLARTKEIRDYLQSFNK